MVNDTSRAFFHARAKREVFVQLPKEDVRFGEGNMSGRLKYSMYGTRDGAQNWYDECSGQLKKIGFKQARASLCLFYREGKTRLTHICTWW